MIPRAIVIVLDGVGVGELPDAGAYGDQGSDTLGTYRRRRRRCASRRWPALGLARAAALPGVAAPASPRAAFGRMAERSPGKDSVTGHWELMGLVLERPFPDVSARFSGRAHRQRSRPRIGRGVLGNVVASGTAIIDELGEQHLRTGRPIVYTSADSVFQIAAHEDIVPVAAALRLVRGRATNWRSRGWDSAGSSPGRSSARRARFTRTANRHDFAMPPPRDTLLDRLTAAGVPVTAIGKVGDLFAGRGITTSRPTTSDDDGLDQLEAALDDGRRGLVFVNLVDFDTPVRAPQRRRAASPPTSSASTAGSAAIVDGSAPATCWSSPPITATIRRRRAPITRASTCRCCWPATGCGPGVDLGMRDTFADVGQTLAAWFGVEPLPAGTSLLDALS